ncbi:MAG: hypothetical protein LQ339_002261 [Xanthoria mediterranea]|nr:MAG: hypothetical protein LQ339_002261 [Xanthoria mediterranea]
MSPTSYAAAPQQQFQETPDRRKMDDCTSNDGSWNPLTTSIDSHRKDTLTRNDAALPRLSRDHRAAVKVGNGARYRPRFFSAQRFRGRIRSTPITARIDSSRRAGLISTSEAKEARHVQKTCLAAKSARVQKLRDQRALITSKAKEDAEIKALERAMEGLTLDAKIMTTPAEPLSPHSLILSLAYAITFITNHDHAKRVYDHLPASLADPSYIDSLSNKHQRGVRLLLREQDKLRSVMKKSGSIEAALMHQDERIAAVKDRGALRDEFLLADEGVHDLADEEEHAVPDGPPHATDSTSRYQSVLDTMTNRQKAADQQTAEDPIAVEHDPKLRLPNRKRRNRVESAKRAGRTDLCAMEQEFRRQKADELKQSEVERIADETNILERTPDAEDPQFLQADTNLFRAIKRHCGSHPRRQCQEVKVKEEPQPHESIRSRPWKRPQRDNYRPIYRRRSKSPAKSKKEKRHLRARDNAPSETHSYPSANHYPTEHPVPTYQPPPYGPLYNPPPGLPFIGLYATQHAAASSYIPVYGLLHHQQQSWYSPVTGDLLQTVPCFGYQYPPYGTQYTPAYPYMGNPWP